MLSTSGSRLQQMLGFVGCYRFANAIEYAGVSGFNNVIGFFG